MASFKTLPQSNPFRYDMKEPYASVTCVFKLWFGKKYIIMKCKALHQALQNYSIQIDRDIRNGVKDGSILYNVIRYVTHYNPVLMTAEVLHATDDPLDLLKEEYKILKAAQEDKDCLNVRFSVDFPKWIPNDVVVEFQHWLTSLTQAKRAATIEGKKAPAKKVAKPAAKKTGAIKQKDLPGGVKIIPGKSMKAKLEHAEKASAGLKSPVPKKAAAAKKIKAPVLPKRGRRPGSKDSTPRTRRTKAEMAKLAAPAKKPAAATSFARKGSTTANRSAKAGRSAPAKAIVPAPVKIGKVSTKGQQPAQANLKIRKSTYTK